MGTVVRDVSEVHVSFRDASYQWISGLLVRVYMVDFLALLPARQDT